MNQADSRKTQHRKKYIICKYQDTLTYTHTRIVLCPKLTVAKFVWISGRFICLSLISVVEHVQWKTAITKNSMGKFLYLDHLYYYGCTLLNGFLGELFLFVLVFTLIVHFFFLLAFFYVSFYSIPLLCLSHRIFHSVTVGFFQSPHSICEFLRARDIQSYRARI